MDIMLRSAKSADAEAIAELTDQLGYPIPVSDTGDSLEALLANDKELVAVVEIENKVVAWMHVSRVVCLESTPFGEIRGLVVDQDHHRKGIGRLLVEKAKSWCLEKSLQRLRVRSQTKRKDAHTFYESFGFSETKVQRVFDLRLS